MSRRASGLNGMGVKRNRKHGLASFEATVHAEPLTLLAVVKSHLHMLVCAQLCDPQGVAMSPFVRLLCSVTYRTN